MSDRDILSAVPYDSRLVVVVVERKGELSSGKQGFKSLLVRRIATVAL